MSYNGRDTARMRIIQAATADPAAGANATLALTGHPSKILVAASFRLTTAVAAANRLAHLDWHHGATQIRIAVAGSVQIASLTVDYYIHPGSRLQVPTNTNCVPMTIPVELDLQSDDYLDLVIDNIQAADQLSNIFHFWKVHY